MGRGTNPNHTPIGENGNHIPTSMIAAEVMTSGQLARLWMKGILFVRITWIIRVCVSNDSTNQPVWNNAAAYVESGLLKLRGQNVRQVPAAARALGYCT